MNDVHNNDNVRVGVIGWLQPAFPKVYFSEGSMFRRFIVQKVNCSEIFFYCAEGLFIAEESFIRNRGSLFREKSLLCRRFIYCRRVNYPK